MAAPSLSIAIVTYRTEAAVLARALGTLAAAVARARAADELGEVQVHLVDNGSEHARGAIREGMGAWPASAGTIELHAGHGNVGYGRANNLLRSRLGSDFHLVMNPDVALDDDALRAGLSRLRTHPEVGLLAPAAYGADGAMQYLCKRLPSVWVLFLRGFAPAAWRERHLEAIHQYELRDVVGDRYAAPIPLASGAFMLMRTPLFVRLGFDPRYFMYFEDYDLSLRLAATATIAYEPAMKVVHGGGHASRKGPRHVGWFLASAMRFFSRHGWRLRG